MGGILSAKGGARHFRPGREGADGEPAPCGGPGLSITVSAPLQTPLLAPRTPGASSVPRLSPGVFKPAPGPQHCRDWLPGRGRPSLPPPSHPPLPVDRVSPAWHGGPICFQSGPALSAPSSGLCPRWGPLPPCPHSSPPRPQLRGGAASLCLHPSPTLWGVLCLWGRGLCHPAQTGWGSFCPLSDLQYLGVFGEPSAVWASSPFIRCHGHDQHLEGGGAG